MVRKSLISFIHNLKNESKCKNTDDDRITLENILVNNILGRRYIKITEKTKIDISNIKHIFLFSY